MSLLLLSLDCLHGARNSQTGLGISLAGSKVPQSSVPRACSHALRLQLLSPLGRGSVLEAGMGVGGVARSYPRLGHSTGSFKPTPSQPEQQLGNSCICPRQAAHQTWPVLACGAQACIRMTVKWKSSQLACRQVASAVLPLSRHSHTVPEMAEQGTGNRR